MAAKKAPLAGALLVLHLASSACASLETIPVSKNEVASTQGEALAVIQADVVGLSAFLYYIDFVQADLDRVINRMLVTEAKAMGATRVELVEAHQTPRNGIFSITGLLLGVTRATATGIAVREADWPFPGFSGSGEKSEGQLFAGPAPILLEADAIDAPASTAPQRVQECPQGMPARSLVGGDKEAMFSAP